MIFLAKTTTKDVHISLPNKDKLQFFIEVLSKALEHVEFILNYKQGGIRVRLFGERDSVLQSVGVVKTFGKMISNSITPDHKGFYHHHLRLIQHLSTKIVSLDSIASALYYSGIPAFVEGQELITEADMNTVQNTLEELLEIIQNTPLDVRSQAMKKVILTVSYATGYQPVFIIDVGVNLDLFQYQKNSVSISESPEKCIEELIEKLSEEGMDEEYKVFEKKQRSINDISTIR